MPAFDVDALRAQIDQMANSAQFNGLNLVSAGGSNLNVVMSDLSTGTAGRHGQHRGDGGASLSTLRAGTDRDLAGRWGGHAACPSTRAT